MIAYNRLTHFYVHLVAVPQGIFGYQITSTKGASVTIELNM